MLTETRVLDLTDDRGHFAGLILAQLGADVVLVEPPGGHRSRRLRPLLEGTGNDSADETDGSLLFLAYNRGKRSFVLDDAAELDRLAAGADAILHSGASFGDVEIDLSALRERHPHLVTANITPFGETGPKADWAATDLTISAASGTTSLTGDDDRAPVRIGRPQTWLNAGADTAIGVLTALHERRHSGVGQHVDLSAQQSFVDCTQFQMMSVLVGMDAPTRLPGAMKLGDFLIRWVYECGDGHVTSTFLFGPMMGPFTRRMMDWVHEEGFCSAEIRDTDWVDFANAIAEGRQSMDVFTEAIAGMSAFLLTKTKDELLERALSHNLLIAPVTTTADVLALDQLDARDYWEHVEVPAPAGTSGATTARFPGSMAKVDGAPLPSLPPAPSLGEHTEPVRAEARSLSIQPTGAPARVRPLEDVKILDFMWALAGPGTTRTLADYGATVVKIESESKPEVLRGVNPFIGDTGDQESALQFHSLNAGKMGLTLDLSTSEGLDVARDLVRWADVVTESFSPKAMANWGLGYDELKAINPEIVMFSSCLMGQTGPMRMYAGFGTMAAAIAGFYPIVGWPDRMPAGPFIAYTDYISPKLSVPLILAALDQRSRTGKGMHIDFSQLEGALHFLAPELLDEEINGHTANRHGNADLNLCPHGAYPVVGDDRWITVACETDQQWAALAEIIGRADLSGLGESDRRDRSDEIDTAIAAWSSGLDVADAEQRLQSVGVPSHGVSDADDLMADPQIIHRNHFLRVPHPIHGETFVENSCFELSRTPGRTDWGGPTFGQHSMEVLEGILGYDGDQIAELVIAGAIA